MTDKRGAAAWGRAQPSRPGLSLATMPASPATQARDRRGSGTFHCALGAGGGNGRNDPFRPVRRERSSKEILGIERKPLQASLYPGFRLHRLDSLRFSVLGSRFAAELGVLFRQRGAGGKPGESRGKARGKPGESLGKGSHSFALRPSRHHPTPAIPPQVNFLQLFILKCV